ncbi:MAG TPA: hypothetical protein VFX76_03140 [Roseiflexaceae bacterium]|nr:hypothetical protein [Roseiflexaceae bacterium]
MPCLTRDNGEFSAAALNAALENLDADQISIELRESSLLSDAQNGRH